VHATVSHTSLSPTRTHTLYIVYIYRWIHDSRVRLRPVQPSDRYRVGTTGLGLPYGSTGSRIRGSQCQARPIHKTQWNLMDLDKFAQWHLELQGLSRRQTDRHFLVSERSPGQVDERTSKPSTRQASKSAVGENMHASKDTIILVQCELWNETLYDILIASVSLSPSQMDHVSKSFASTSDGQAIAGYSHTLITAKNRRKSG
jgi:hypothetical protein